MQLQTIVPIKPLENKIDYHSKIVSVGSCFAVNMAQRFQQFQFQQAVNPFGILFHPVAIARLVDFAVENKTFTEEDVFLHNEIWSSFDAHSDLNELEQEDIIDTLNAKIQVFRNHIMEASHLILTFGTAWVYRHIEKNQWVANCHKVTQQQFSKELLSVTQCQEAIASIENGIRSLSPNIQIIYTLSPVRHIKDGYVENQRSKAHLIAALHQHLDQSVENNYYFPSFELVMDELRDYRFFAKDLIHPNEIAIDYIWEKFVEHVIDPAIHPTMKLVDEVQKGLAHRPFNPYTEAHQKFLDKLAQKLDVLLEQYPFMNFR
jgi:hypothetical protein